MAEMLTALYARVSSDQQAEAHTIGSQVAALRARVAEDGLLLQVQGVMAEYERAKILERSRRGKRHGAHLGNVAVLSGAPFGYRYIRKDEGGGAARYEIVLDEARVVRQVFHWVGLERASIGEVCRRLNAAGERTRTGHVWERSVVWAMLKNPAYQGQAAFGKTQAGPLGPRLRAQRGRALQPRRAVAEHTGAGVGGRGGICCGHRPSREQSPPGPAKPTLRALTAARPSYLWP